MTIEEIQQQIVDEFSMADDWMDRYSMLIDLGGELASLNEQERIPQNVIDGCQSRVWLVADYVAGRVVYRADSDAILVRGLVALLIRVMSDHTPDEILAADLHFINEIGLSEHLSPTRSNGLVAMVKQMRLYALAFKTKYASTDSTMPNADVLPHE